MVFSSFEFLFWFLPFCIIVYMLVSKHAKNLVLLFFSIVFYAYGAIETPAYLWLILASVVINWICGMFIGRKDSHQKHWLIVGLVWDFGNLFVFKYADFFIRNLNHLPLIDLPLTNLILPLGISFFTFQIASYLIDVYRGDVKVEYSLIDLGTYILLFPQLIAGPIVRFSDVQTELHKRTVNRAEFFDGLQIFIIGLGKKVLLANRLGSLWTDLQNVGYESITGKAAWMGIFAYSMQLYFDFSGYSQMAIGMGKMFGFHFPENFNHPYLSTTMTEFWRRWHMTLGTWFKEYVYFPLGGNRKGKKRMYLNMFVVWTLTGFWHGADWNFILWGMLLFALLSVEKAWIGKTLTKQKWLGHLYMLFWIPMSWLLFAISDLKQIGIYLSKLFGYGEPALFQTDYINYWETYGKWLLIGLLFCTALPQNIFRYMKKRTKRTSGQYFWIGETLLAGFVCISAQKWVYLPLLFIPFLREYAYKSFPKRYRKSFGKLFWIPELVVIFSLSCYCIYRGMNDPFLYFRF
ncbi:MAG TPA: membrane-bound O-acyltransferase family protein [Ruminococcus sp.]|nr:membrane-bound O-acyltransferase family protein [Ruminococcus sp.]